MTTGISPQDFMKRLDATAADTETLLAKLLAFAGPSSWAAFGGHGVASSCRVGCLTQ